MKISRNDRERYLLRTPSQVLTFRERYTRTIDSRAEAFRAWVRSLPMMKWCPLLIRPGNEELAIGIICILYIDGQICISFSEDMQFIRNEPIDDEEYRQWTETFFKRLDYRRKSREKQK